MNNETNLNYKEMGRNQIDKAKQYIRAALKEKYGTIKDEFIPIIQQFEMQYLIFIMCRNSIIKNGVQHKNKYGVLQKNPSVPMLQASAKNIREIYTKLKLFPAKEDAIEDADEFINNLTKD